MSSISSWNKVDLSRAGVSDVISEWVAKSDKGYKAQYNPTTNRITVLNTQGLPRSILDKMLYELPLLSKYDQYNYYPVVEEERNQEGNLQVSFSPSEPDNVKSIKQEVLLMKEKISSGVINAMKEFLNKH